jgi:hypothetical protein
MRQPASRSMAEGVPASTLVALLDLTRKMHRLGRIKRKTLMLRMIEIVSQISAVFATPASTNDSLWLRGGL